MERKFNFGTLRTAQAQEATPSSHSEEAKTALERADAALRDTTTKVAESRLHAVSPEHATALENLRARRMALLGNAVDTTPAAVATYKDIQKNIAELAAEDPHYRAMLAHREQNVTNAVWDYRRLHNAERMMRRDMATLAGDRDTLSLAERNELAESEALLHKIHADLITLYKANPEAYYTLDSLELRKYARQHKEGSIIETPSVEEKADLVEGFVRAGRPVLLHGAPGTGKTELAMHVAKKIAGDRDAEGFRIVSGSRFTEVSELTGHQKVSARSIDEAGRARFLAGVDTEYNTWLAAHTEVTSEEKVAKREDIRKAYELSAAQGMETEFWKGPLYEAMQKGLPLIIDEANAIPPEVMIVLNHHMTRRPGDIIRVQEDSGEQITVAPGFSIIFTGNIGSQYQGRFRFESSFINRIGDASIEYDYLPYGELHAIMLASLMPTERARGSLVMPESDLSTLEDLAYAVALAQKIFQGKDDMQIPDGMNGTTSIAESGILKHTPVSMRNVINILDSYKKDNFAHTLKWHVYNAFIRPIINPAERDAYFRIFQNAGVFTADIEPITKRDQNGAIIDFSATVPDDAPEDRFQTFSPSEVVDIAYGAYAPERDYSAVALEGSSKVEKGSERLESLDFDAYDKKLADAVAEITKMEGAYCAI